MTTASEMGRREWSPRRALAEMPASVRENWRERYLTLDGEEHAAQAVLERAEAAMRSRGEPTTIRTLWITLADQATRDKTPMNNAAAALAGLALGLVAG